MFVDMFQLGRSYISSIDSDKDAGGLRLSCMKMRTSFLNMSRDARDARRQASFLTWMVYNILVRIQGCDEELIRKGNLEKSDGWSWVSA